MPVSAPIANLAIFQGEDKDFDDQIFQEDGATVQDISDWAVIFVVHKYGDPDTEYIRKTMGGGVTLTNPSQGVLTFSIFNADTVGMFPGQYSYYVERVDAGNDAVLTVGLFTIQRRSGYYET